MKTALAKERLFSILMYILTISFLIYLLFIIYYFNRTFDFTDDSYYLLHAKHADVINFGITHFGHYTGLLYKLSFKNIFIFRIIGLALLLGVSYYFLFNLELLLNKAHTIKHKIDYRKIIIITSSVLLYYGSYFLLTPSYNWLVFIGLLIFFGGLLSLLKEDFSDRINMLYLFKVLYLSLGGWLAWIAKPPAAIVCFCLFLLYILMHHHNEKIKKIKLVLCTSLSVILLFIIHILLFEDNVFIFFNKYVSGLKAAEILGGHNEPIVDKLLFFYVDVKNIFLSVITGRFSIICIVLFFITKMFFWYGYKKHLRNNQIIFSISLFCTILLIMSFFPIKFYQDFIFFTPFYKIENLAVILVYLYCSLLFIIILNGDIDYLIMKRTNGGFSFITFIIDKLYYIGWSFIILSGAVAAVIGTNNPYQGQMYLFCFFIVVAIYILFKINYFLKYISFLFVIIIGLISCVSVYGAMHKPYRMDTPVFSNNSGIELRQDGNNLILNDAGQQYINTLQTLADRNGWREGNYLIDLTGATPGALVALGAKPVGIAWLLGGYPGSREFALLSLRSVNVDVLKRSWILTSPNGNQRITTDVLKQVDLQFPENYIKVVTTVFNYNRHETHYLWKPKY